MISEEIKKCIIIILGAIIIIIALNSLATFEYMEADYKNIDVVNKINKTVDNTMLTIKKLF